MAKMKIKRKSKDTVFTFLFSEVENVFKLYQELHPEDIETSPEEISIVTLENILLNGQYNDLGFKVRDHFIILLESQSTWSMNILIRGLFYLADTYKRYFDAKGTNLYSTNKAKMPEPELYLVYTKDCKRQPEVISLSREFFDGKKIALDLEMKVIYGQEKATILGQYVSFCKVLDAQVAKYDYTKKAMEETIRICKNQKVLEEFLKTREVELMEIMDYLYDEEIIMRNYRTELLREGEARGEARGRSEGISIGEAEGKDNCAELMGILLKAGRIDDALRATEDKAYLDQLIEELVMCR